MRIERRRTGGKLESLSFGEFVLDRANALLWRGQERVNLPPKPFAVLCHLVERAGALVTKDELLDAVWSNLHVTESSLSVSINALRLALGDDSKSPRFVETAPRRGYRFIAPVAVLAEPVATPEPQARRAEPLVQQTPRAAARAQWWVGREDALAEAERRFEQAEWGRRQILFVTGEGGLGKTTFVEMLARRLASRDVGVLVGRCIEHFGTDEAFLPLNEALADACAGQDGALVLSVLRERAPTWLAQLPGQIPGRDASALKSETFGASRERMIREFCELVEALGQTRPFLLVVEDLHWSDYATLDVLSRFAQRSQRAAAMVVATYRPVDVVVGGHPTRALHQELQIHGRCAEIALSALSLAEIERHLTLRLGSAELAHALAPTLRRRTGGHPLFVVSLVDYFLDRGEIVRVEGGFRLAPGKSVSQRGMPRDLSEMIERQIDALSVEDQRALEAASAVGAEFAAAAVAGALAKDGGETELIFEELARKAQIVAADGVAEWPDGTVSGRYAFRHALYQEAIHQRLSPGRRVLLHRQLGLTLERGFGARSAEIAAVLALHFEEGRDYARAVRYLADAADASTKRFSNQEAGAYLTRALGLVERLPPDEDRLAARLLLLNKRGWARRSAGDLAGSLVDLSVMNACAAEAGQTAAEVAGLMDLSRFSLYVDRSRCLELAREAARKAQTLDDPAMRAVVRGNCANLSLLLEGWSREQAQICHEAMRACADSKDPHVVLRRRSIDMVLQFLTSEYRACAECAQAAQGMAQAIGDVYLFAIYNMLESFALLYLGEWSRLNDGASAALAMSRRNANRQAAALSELSIAWLRAEALDYAGARAGALACVDPEIEKNPFNFFLIRNLLMRAAVGLGDYEEARRQLAAIEVKILGGAPMDTSFFPQHLDCLTRLALESGDLSGARRAASRQRDFAALQGERTYLALAHRALGEVEALEGDGEAAAREFDAGLALVEAAELPLAAWRLYFSAAEFFAGRGELSRAGDLRAKGRALVEALAAGLNEGDPSRAAFLEACGREARVGGRLNRESAREG
ncbi:AAA family ATPase [Methylocella sp.]|uniref:AAA family ATPase n=1 Tax=Methylocella sp. TaxID=1978226 RepID=UPI003784DA60